jgi:hypothetical protein
MNTENKKSENKEQKKEIKYLGWANGWYYKDPPEVPEIVKNCHHRLKEEKTGRCEHRYTCEICGFYYMVDSSD